MEAGDGGVDRVVDSKDLQQQSKAFDKLTDRVEDRQLDSSRAQSVLFLYKFMGFSFCRIFILFYCFLWVLVLTVSGHGIDCSLS